MRILYACLCLVGLAALSSSSAEPLLQQANSWKAGQPIPRQWLSYRKTAPGPAYMPGGNDTGAFIEAITNKSLLVEMLFQTEIEERVFAAVVERGLHCIGPQTFLSTVLTRYQQKPEWVLFPAHKGLFIEIQERHVLADAMFISETEIAPDKAAEAMRYLISDLQSGKSWEAVFAEHSEKLRTPMTVELPGGTKSIAVSQLAQTGPMVICDAPDARQTFAGDRLPPEHRAELLKRNRGEVVLIRDPAHARVVLYRVREVYSPKHSI
jgi:hypothetical protein